MSCVPAGAALNASYEAANGNVPYTLLSLQMLGYVSSAKRGQLNEKAAAPSEYWKEVANRKNGDLYLGEIEVPDMQEDIRTPIVYSKTLTRLRFVPNDGTREIYFLNFASHS